MALFRWRESVALGIPDIDDDHKHLIGLLNRLHFMVLAGDETSAVGEALDSLVRRFEWHFRREEALMLRIGYPHYERHRRLHAALHERLTADQACFHRRPKRFDAASFYDLLADWLVVHMMREDLRLKPYIAAAASAVPA
jgi:hemerythrin-like metal-binding protein